MTDSQTAARYFRLRDRDLRAEGIFVAEGRLLVERAIAAGCLVEAVFAARSCAREAEAIASGGSSVSGASGAIPVIALPDDELSALAGFDFHRGMLAVVRRPAESFARDDIARGTLARDPGARVGSGILVLPSITDPGNLGTLLRSALAFGFDTVWLGGESCDPFNRKALRSSMGASLTLRLRRAEAADLGALAGVGMPAYAAEIAEGAIVAGEGQVEFPCALVLGNEHDGIPASWRSLCGESVMIAVSGDVDSLNVAIAGSLLMWEISRRAPR